MNSARFIRRLVTFFFFCFFLRSLVVTSYAIETTTLNFLLYPSQPYVDTGMDILVGSYLDIHQSGTTSLVIPGSTVPFISPAGDPGCSADLNYTMPGVNCWSLVARIGANPPLFIGSGFGNYSLQNGRLYLGINHKIPFSGSGSWTIRVIRNQTPPPLPPAPFLELPWDYGQATMSAELQVKEFSTKILKINSFFDHKYPLLSVGLALAEPAEAAGSIVSYQNFPEDHRPYSSHDGYDWGRSAGATPSAEIRAAANGCAHYHYGKTTIGNAIYIDHPNHYQTRYYHLLKEDLITDKDTPCTPVTQGQTIGKVGSTGNSDGAHLHFMVVEDKDRDGQFDDNIPDGLTDPFGWQSSQPDPWPAYSFSYAGESRTGNISNYLWLHPIPNLSADLPTNGGFYTFQNLQLNFPSNAVPEKTRLFILRAPNVVIAEMLESIGTSFIITVQNLFGTIINQFNQQFSLTIDFSHEDLSRIDPNTLQIYSSADGTNWTPEVTTLDLQTKTASAMLNHLTQFALIGERLDTEPPATIVTIQQLNNSNNTENFTATVSATLSVTDNHSGVDYTLYRTQDVDWQTYTEPLIFSTPGNYSFEYYSVDTHENKEAIQTKTFTIIEPLPSPTPDPTPDPTPSASPEISPTPTPTASPTPSATPISAQYPEALISINLNNFSFDLTASGSSSLIHTTENKPDNKTLHTFTDTDGLAISLLTKFTKTFFYNQLNVENISYLPPFQNTVSGTLTATGFRDKKGVVAASATWLTNNFSLTTAYERLTNRTYVLKTQQNKIQTETLPGLRLLKLNTNKGIIEYKY